jgi:hypothetical protein
MKVILYLHIEDYFFNQINIKINTIENRNKKRGINM